MPARIVSNPSDAMDTSDDATTVANKDASNSTPQPKNGASSSSVPPDTGNRRRSTRVVKKPTLLATQQAAEPLSKTKRKRPVREESSEEGEGEEGEEEEEEAAEGEGEDAAEKPKSKPKPKPKAKSKEPEKEGSGDEEEEGEDEDEDEDEDDEESSSEEDSSEGEPDEEEIKERRKRNAAARARRGQGRLAGSGTKKPPTKKTRTASGAVAVTPARKSSNGRKKAGGKSKGKGKAKPVNGERDEEQEDEAGEVENNALYDSVFEGEEDHDDVAQAWTVKYEDDNAEAMKEMVNFILRCCGCEKTVTNYDIEDQDSAATTLSQIQEAFQRQKHADYPLTSKKPEFRRFRQHLSSFLHSLMSTFSAREILYTDPALVENLQVWITAMSSSTLRQFRHTSTVVALDLVSSLATIAAEARKANSTTNRQFEAEGKKGKRNEGRITALETKLKEGEERREVVENIIKDIFDTVFVHRYRDIDAKIRSDCVRELGSWILTLPDVFFDGSYLRYLGWVLSDTTPTTRLEVVKALTKLFKKKDSVSGLRHFTERFRPRLVEMATRDADSSVRAATVELLDVVREVGYLEPADVDTVGRLLFDSEPKVRRAVVGFFVENIGDLYEEKIEELGGEETVLEALGDDSDENFEGPTLSWIKLKCLVEVLATYDLEDGAADEDIDAATQGIEKSTLKIGDAESRFSLAGSVLWEAFEEVGDWEGVAKYLLYDHSEGARVEEGGDEEDVEKKVKAMVALEAREEAILLQLLNASVAANIAEGGEGGKKRGAAKRTAKEIEKHVEIVSRNLMTLIPPLLKKFGPVPDAASSVLRLEQLMKLDVFQELRQSTAYASLLDDINRQFLTHADESVLKEASAALLHAKTFEELDEVTDQKVGQLKDETVTALVNAVRGKDLGKGKFSDASLTELINTVRRLEYIASITNCVETMETPPATSEKEISKTAGLEPIEVLMALLQRGGSVDELEEELIIRTMKTLEYYFMWKISSINEIEDLADLDIDDLTTRRNGIMERIGGILKNRTKVDPVKITAATTIMGLATLFIAAAARNEKKKPATEGADGVVEDAAEEIATKLAALGRKLDATLEAEVLKVFDVVEKTFAKSSGSVLEPDELAAPEDVDSDTEVEDTEKTETDESVVLLHEQRLCEFAGKIVLAVLAGAVDEQFKKRLDRNVSKLGPSYREVVAHLSSGEEAVKKVPGKRGRKPRPHAGEIVVDSDDDEHEHEHEHELGHEESEEHAEAETEAEAEQGKKAADKKSEPEEEDEEEGEEEEERHHAENAELEDEEKDEPGVESDNESEPDLEVEVPPDGDEDEDMPDVGDE